MDQTSSRPVSLAVCLLTFRRPEGLRSALQALVRQEFKSLPQPDLQLVVVDNNPLAYAPDIVAEILVEPWKGSVLHEPLPGIARARNRALEAVRETCDFIVFFDDDEEPAPNWIEQLLIAQSKTQSDVVAGPVETLYFEGTPEWVRAGGFFEGPQREDLTPIRGAPCSNVLFSATLVRDSGLRFDETLGTLGGEDTLFFERANRKGHPMVWAAKAIVREPLDPARARVGWLMKRWLNYAVPYRRIWELDMGAVELRLYLLFKGLSRLLAGLLTLPFAAILGPFAGWHLFVKRLKPLARGLSMLLSLLGVYAGEDKSR